MNYRVQRDQPGEEVVQSKYKWAYETLARAGLLRVDVDERDPKLLRIDDGPLLPLCYAALAARVWKQKQTHSEGVSSYLPAERLGSLVIAIRDQCPKFGESSWEEAWEIVNTTCKRIFGRTVLEETDADFALEQNAIEVYRKNFSDSVFFKALTDLHELRGRMIEMLKEKPELFLDQAAWSDHMVNRTKPAIVVAAPGGEVGTPPTGYTRLSGYNHPNTNFEDKPEARWWWAAMNTTWPDAKKDPEAICVRDLEAWGYIAGEYAPLAKLMYAGQDMRLMLGPELLSARLRFKEQTGIQMVVDPAFAYPKTTHDAKWWYYITGFDNFRCQLSNETVHKPEGYMLDAWDLRIRPGLAEAILGSVADRQLMAFTFWRDWSPWMLSEEFRDFFESFEVDEARLYEMLS